MYCEKQNDGPVLGQDTEALISNGLDFLNKAREEFQAGQAKFSVVSFWTAVEILIKVPLVHEHWTLACSGKKMERKKYLSGDFQSVTYDEACARLNDVLDMPLEAEVAKRFSKVKNHRNRVVHFYHNELSAGDQQQVLTEQADAWFALNGLMRNEWSVLFARRLRERLAEDETNMIRSNAFYADAKFRDKAVQEQLRKETEAGEILRTCVVCGCTSAVRQLLMSGLSLYDETCFVCGEQPAFLEIQCTGCGEAARVQEGDSDFLCGRCGYQSDRYEAINPLSVEEHDETDAAGCADCLRPDSVCSYRSMYASYLCTGCFYAHDVLEQCDRCFRWSCDSAAPVSNSDSGCMFCAPGKQPRYIE